MTIASLTKRYERQCQDRKLPLLDAEELILQLNAKRDGENSLITPNKTTAEIEDDLGWLNRFIEVWNRVQGEEDVLQLLHLEALKAGYLTYFIDDGEEVIRPDEPGGFSFEEVKDFAMAVEESKVCFRHSKTKQKLHFFLTAGNSPCEFIRDHTDHPDAEAIYRAALRRYGCDS